MHYSMSNTTQGARVIPAGEALTANLLLVLAAAGTVGLPTAVDDPALYLALDDAASGSDAEVLPLSGDQQIRVRAKGTGSAGAVLALADPSTAADKGKVRALPAAAGTYFSPGIAEENFVDGQLVAVRPWPHVETVS